MVPGLMETSSSVSFLMKWAVEVNVASEAVEAIEAAEVPDAKKSLSMLSACSF